MKHNRKRPSGWPAVVFTNRHWYNDAPYTMPQFGIKIDLFTLAIDKNTTRFLKFNVSLFSTNVE